MARRARNNTSSVHAVAISADHSKVAAAGRDWIAIWETATGRLIRSINAGAPNPQVPGSRKLGGGVLAMAFSNDARQLVVNRGLVVESLDFRVGASGNGSALDGTDTSRETSIWDIDRGAKLRTVSHEADINSERPLLSMDGSRIAVCSRGDVRVWDASTSERLNVLTHPGKFPKPLAFSPDGRQLLSQDENALFCWNSVKGTLIWSHRMDHRNVRLGAAFGPRADRIMMSRTEGAFAVLDAATGRTIQSFRCPVAKFVAYLPDGRQAFVSSSYGFDAIIRCDTGDVVRRLKGGVNCVSRVRFAATGQHVLVNNTLWDLDKGKSITTCMGEKANFSRDGRYVATAQAMWECRTGRQVAKFKGSFGTDGSTAPVSTGSSGWRVGSRAPDPRNPGPSLLTTGLDSAVWDLASGRQILAIPEKGWVTCLSPDGRLAVVSHGPEVAVWDIDNQRKLYLLSGSACRDVPAFSRDSRYLATAAAIHTNVTRNVALWDVATGRSIRELATHPSPVTSVSFSPDGSQLLTTSTDQTAAVWDLRTGRNLRSFRGHTGWATSGAFSPDGRFVLTGSDDGTARLWELATGEELALLTNTGKESPLGIDIDAHSQWLVATRHGLFDGSPEGRRSVAYRVGGGLNVVPVDRFFQDFYRPGLLASIWQGDRPLPMAEFATNVAPQVQIISPNLHGTVASQQVTIRVQVVDRGGGVKGPWLLQNGARILPAGQSTGTGDTAERSFVVALTEGENRIEVRAASGDGSWESEPASITLLYEQPLERPRLRAQTSATSHERRLMKRRWRSRPT